ncbi:porin [Herbaspirillum chlorophenolicum]|jgi:predicted porin|uniref:porin n=1 Tax=Herbaspirillum chlorophenolicum TaxID=211589 RepID=UPI0009E3706D|nr:porin [Herbaspirillum chlorophenolicum]
MKQKQKALYAALAVMGWAAGAPVAHAQSSVTISGMIDTGLTYVNNQNGGKNMLMDSGILAPSLVSIKGAEDLGDGTSAVFELTSQFDGSDGSIVPSNGALFNRTSLVGLRSAQWGTLTVGNQYELMFDTLTLNHYDGAFLFGGLYDFRQGPFTGLGIPNNPTGAFDFDRMAGGTRVANSVKYKSIDLKGFTFSGLYGFGEVAGKTSSSNTVSLGANYANGPFGIGAAYTNQKYAALNNGDDGIRNYGVGAHYQFGPVLAMALYTNTRNTANRAEVDVYKIGAKWDFATVWTAGLDYSYMKGNAQVNNNKAQQLAAALQYHMSKRTHLYVQTVYQHVRGDGATAWINGLLQTNGASSGSSQAVLRAGIFHTF